MLGYAGAYHRTHHALLHPRPTGCGPQGLVFERSAIPMLAPLLESFPQPRGQMGSHHSTRSAAFISSFTHL